MTRSAFEPQGNVRLRPDRHKKLLNGYPWAHKGDLQSADPGLEPGGLVRIESSQGEFVGIGSYLPEGRFPVRLFTNRDERIDERFFLGRFESALKRRPLTEWNTDAYRALFSEADGVPGLVLDVYRKRLVVQVRSLGMERLREAWMPALLKAFEPDSILERSDMAGRLEEGLEPLVADLYGTSPDEVPLTEGGLEFRAQIRSGPKTGFYLDQRESRALLRASVRPNDKVLDLFCFSGAFAISAAAAGARVTGIDLRPGGDPARQGARQRERDRSELHRSQRVRLARGGPRKGDLRLDRHRPSGDLQEPREERLPQMGDLEAGVPLAPGSGRGWEIGGLQLLLCA
ncbi:MAG: Ribosomal RNA large subunit methyltransferase I [Armatimonadetes bacterium OLB18]|nr:MAG: Ribosomal RNA large subunit methyltransferase I [Armatimonadetes bacterium OLB18]